MKTLSTLTLLLYSFTLSSQMGNFSLSQNDNFTMDVSQLRAETVHFEIKGSPYFDETYRLGHIFFKGEKLIFFFRYNALEDRVELKDRTTQVYHLQKKFILEPIFGGKSYKYMFYLEEDDRLERGYMVLLEKGEKLSLYHKLRKEFKQAEAPDHGYDVLNRPVFQDVSGYYYQHGNEVPRPLKLRKAALLKLLSDKKMEMLQFISQQELNLSNESDVRKLIQYYNRIS